MKSSRVQRTESTGRLITIGLFTAILCLLFLILCFLPPAQAAPGDLDLSFGGGGIVTTPIGTFDDQAYALAIQSDGKLVAAGYSNYGTFQTGSQHVFALLRHNTNGSLDTTFGSAGKVTTPIGTFDDEAHALVIQSDGKLVAAGYSNSGTDYDFALVRYNTNGTLDATFGTGGKVTTSIGANEDIATALVIQPDGKLVAAGSSDIGTQSLFALVRYNTNGTLDATFGTGGIATTPIGASAGHATALAIQLDGKLVAAGYTANGGQNVFALVRYNTDGSLDTTFGTGGIVNTSIGAINVWAYAMAIQSDGKLVAAGYYETGTGTEFSLVRYNTDGSLDTTFGTGGIVAMPIIGSSQDVAHALAIQPDGKLVAAGQSSNGSGSVFALVRYNTNGSLDTTFGTGGIVTTAIGTVDDKANALAIQPDGKLVAAGYSNNGSQIEFALVRYLGGLTITIPVGASLPTCVADYNGTCAFSPNPLTITSGDSVVWSNTDGAIPHTATSDDHSDTLVLDQPVAPANSFSTAIISGGGSSPAIGPFITAVMQTKLYHCSLHPNMKGTLIILPPPPPTTTTTTTTTITTTTIPGQTTTTSTTSTTIPGQTTTTSSTSTTIGTGGGTTTTTTSPSTTTSIRPITTTTVATTTTTAATTTTTSPTTTTTTTSSTTTTTINCNDKNKGNGKNKGQGQDKGKCKGHDKGKG